MGRRKSRADRQALGPGPSLRRLNWPAKGFLGRGNRQAGGGRQADDAFARSARRWVGWVTWLGNLLLFLGLGCGGWMEGRDGFNRQMRPGYFDDDDDDDDNLDGRASGGYQPRGLSLENPRLRPCVPCTHVPFLPPPKPPERDGKGCRLSSVRAARAGLQPQTLAGRASAQAHARALGPHRVCLADVCPSLRIVPFCLHGWLAGIVAFAFSRSFFFLFHTRFFFHTLFCPVTETGTGCDRSSRVVGFSENPASTVCWWRGGGARAGSESGDVCLTELIGLFLRHEVGMELGWKLPFELGRLGP